MKKILTVATNNTSLNGKKTGLWLSELTHFLEIIEKAGFDYDIASPKGGKIPLDERSLATQDKDPINKKYLNNANFLEKLENSIKCSDVISTEYTALYLTGGHGTIFDFRKSQDLQKVITEFYDNQKYLSGVCHGVSGFLDAKDSKGKLIVKNKVVTGFSNFEDTIAGAKKLLPYLLQDEFKKQGAIYKKNFLPFTERVEIDGQLITGQNPQSATGVAKMLVDKLK